MIKNKIIQMTLLSQTQLKKKLEARRIELRGYKFLELLILN